MKTKALLWIGISVVILGVVAAGIWWELRPQVITFDDGSKLTLLAVDYGKHHRAPQVKTAKGTQAARTFNTTNDTLVLWVRQQYDSDDWHNFQYYVYDKAATACAEGSGVNYGRSDSIVAVQFSAFPRRDSHVYVRVEEGGNGGQEMSDQKFTISNPSRGPFASLAAEPLPDSEQDGDLTVTLKKLVAGAKMPYMRDGDDQDDPVNTGVQAIFNAQVNGTNATQWQPIAIDLSDATSNTLTAETVNTQPQGDDLATTFQYALWPNEPAWKLHVEFSRQSGFDSDELWTVPNIPLQSGRMRDFWNYGTRPKQSTAFAEADLQGLHIKVFPVKQFTDMPPNSQPQGGLTLEIDPALPKGMRLSIVSLTDDQNNDVTRWDYGRNGQKGRKATFYRYGLQNLDGVTNLNLTLALHQSHFLDFTVKPAMQASTPDADQSNQ